MVDPPKRAFFEFEIKTVKKEFVFIFFFSFCFKNNRCTNAILISIFESAQKNVINRHKQPNWHFWQSITFFKRRFQNTDQKNICVSIVFKAESMSKHEEHFFLGGFSLKAKNARFWGSKMVLSKIQISNLYFCVCFSM